LLVLVGMASAIFIAGTAASYGDVVEVAEPSGNDFGGAGLLQTRSARLYDDGTLIAGYSNVFPYERYQFTLQALPWLEATFRYTSVSNRDFAGNTNIGVGSAFKDRGADLKFGLFREGRYRPQVALGFQDGLGTGVFAGEYLVASKRYFDLDFSFGVGWGYIAGSSTIKNPLVNLSDQFKTRSGGRRQGGTLLPSAFFSGETIGFFGGVEYQTPLKGLRLKLEYDPNNFQNEPLNNRFDWNSHLNAGINYRPFPFAEMSVAYERGSAFMVRAVLRANLNQPGIPKFDPPPPALVPRPERSPSKTGVPFGQSQFARRIAGFETVTGTGEDLTALLEVEGYDVISALESDGKVIVRMASLMPGDEERVATFASVFSKNGADQIDVVGPDGGRSHFRGDELQARLPVLLFDHELLRQGVRMNGFTIDNRSAVIDIDKPVEVGGESIARAAGHLDSGIQTVVLSWGSTASEKAVFDVAALSEQTRSPRSTATERASATPKGVDLGGFSRRHDVEAIFKELGDIGIGVEAVRFGVPRTTIWIGRSPFRQVSRSIGRAAVVVANKSPPEVLEIEVVLMSGAGELSRVVIRRSDLDNVTLGVGSVDEIWFGGEVSGPAGGIPSDAHLNSKVRPSFSFGLQPAVRQHIGSRDSFYLYQIYARLAATAEISRGLFLETTLGADLYNNFDRLTVETDSVLPRVRSDIKEYLQLGKNNISRLHATYLWSPAPDLYMRLSAGIFEEMYGGYGGEVLLRPFGSRLAVGLDLNYVRQRDFDQLFTFLDYTVTTGHLSVYYALPIFDLLGQIHVGRYLAGDNGATFELSRLFSSGVRVGGFFTLTDVPFEVFGEGSFDKGFFISIPLDLLSTRSSTNGASFGFRPLTKDGGQRLSIRPGLYDLTSGGNLDGIARDWDQLLK
jgi:hypothetical protein